MASSIGSAAAPVGASSSAASEGASSAGAQDAANANVNGWLQTSLGSDEIASWLQFLNDNRQQFAGDDGQYSEEEILAIQAQEGVSLPEGFGAIDSRLFGLLAASDANADDDLIDPSTTLEPKLIAAVNLADMALLPGASPELQQHARDTLDAAIQALQGIKDEASQGAVADFYSRFLAKLGDAPDPAASAALDEAWAHVLGTFNPETEGAAINDVIRAIESGLPKADQERLGGAFDTIIDTLNEASAEDRQKLASDIAQGNISGEIIEQLQTLRTALDNPAALADVAGQTDGVATNFLEAQLSTYGAPLPSEYLLAGLVRSGQIKDPLALTDDERALVDEFSGALAEGGPAGVDPKFSAALGYASQYVSDYDSVLKGQPAEASAQALSQRLRWELGYESTPDGVEEQNIDYMAVLSGDPSLAALSSVANQIRAENPELLQQLLTSDAWMQTYSFTATERSAGDWEMGVSELNVELTDDDQQFLRAYALEHQLDLTLPEHQAQLQEALRGRLVESGRMSQLDSEYLELNIATDVDGSVGQMSNLSLLALTSRMANRAFGADGRPLIMDPQARAAQFAQRAQMGDFTFEFSAHIEMGDWETGSWSEPYGLTPEDSQFLLDYVKANKLDLTTDAGKKALQEAWHTRLRDAGIDIADAVILDISEPQGDLLSFNQAPPVSDREAKGHLLHNGQPVCLDALISDAADVAKKMAQGIAIEEGDPGSLVADLLIPGYGLLHALQNKPSLSERQEWVKAKLEQYGRSTDVLDHMLSLSMDQWKGGVTSMAIMLGLELVAIAGIGAGVAVKAGSGLARAALRGSGEAVIGLVSPVGPDGVVPNMADSARKSLGKLPKVPPSPGTAAASPPVSGTGGAADEIAGAQPAAAKPQSPSAPAEPPTPEPPGQATAPPKPDASPQSEITEAVPGVAENPAKPEWVGEVEWKDDAKTKGKVLIEGRILDVVTTPEGEAVCGTLEQGGTRFSVIDPTTGKRTGALFHKNKDGSNFHEPRAPHP